MKKIVLSVVTVVLLITPLLARADQSLIHLFPRQSASGVIATESYQYLWFSAKQNNPVTFTLGRQGEVWYRFKILDASAKNVLLQSDVEGVAREVVFAPPADGDYYILLLGFYGYGKYQIRFQNILAQQPAFSSEIQLRPGAKRSEEIAVGVRRQFVFDGKANEPLRFVVSPEQNIWFRIRIFAPNGALLRTEDIESARREIIFTPQKSGRYTLTTAGYYGSGSYGIAFDLIKNLL